MKQFLKAAVAATVLAWGGASALAANLSFTGNLAGDNAVQLFSFKLTSTTDVTLRTWSYAGGSNAAGSAIGAGGFDAVLALFSGSGG
ncbi:MAG: DVUA0089 family protein, partial [Burkholderiales bacterium]|nr:DVUA0089 family protein [Burkholderiales bacterium]